MTFTETEDGMSIHTEILIDLTLLGGDGTLIPDMNLIIEGTDILLDTMELTDIHGDILVDIMDEDTINYVCHNNHKQLNRYSILLK